MRRWGSVSGSEGWILGVGMGKVEMTFMPGMMDGFYIPSSCLDMLILQLQHPYTMNIRILQLTIHSPPTHLFPPPPPHTSPKQPLYQLLSYLTIDAEFFDPSKSKNQTEFLYVRLDNNYSTTDEVFVTLYEGIKPQVTKKKQTNKQTQPQTTALIPISFLPYAAVFGLLVVTITL